MARKKKTADSTATATTLATTVPASSEHPGWNPPRQPLQLAIPATEPPTNAPPQLSPPTPPQPTIQYEDVSNASRTLGRVTGYGTQVEIYLERFHRVEDEKAVLEEGKTWFRTVARQFQQQYGAETVAFPTANGRAVDVVFTKNRCKLDKGLVADAASNPSVASLLVSTETLTGDSWTWLLDTAQIPKQDGTGWVTLRQAISMGLNFKVNQETKLRPDYVEVLQNLRRLNALTPEAEGLIEKLTNAGLNEPSVKVSG